MIEWALILCILSPDGTIHIINPAHIYKEVGRFTAYEVCMREKRRFNEAFIGAICKPVTKDTRDD